MHAADNVTSDVMLGAAARPLSVCLDENDSVIPGGRHIGILHGEIELKFVNFVRHNEAGEISQS